MHNIEIQGKGIYAFPEEISEMTNEQFLFFIDNVLQYLNGQINLSEFKFFLVRRFLRRKTSRRKMVSKRCQRAELLVECEPSSP